MLIGGPFNGERVEVPQVMGEDLRPVNHRVIAFNGEPYELGDNPTPTFRHHVGKPVKPSGFVDFTPRLQRSDERQSQPLDTGWRSGPKSDASGWRTGPQ
jgi:hypothetical protein